MGVTLHLGFIDNFPSATEHDGKSFFDEIISASYPNYLNHDIFLSKDEQELLYPDYENPDNSLDQYRHINPARLKDIFEKVQEHLKTHHDQYPLVHTIYDDVKKKLGSSISQDFRYKGYKCHLDGYHNNKEHREEIRVYRHNNGWETFEWIKVDSTITLEGKTFFIETENKYEQYNGILKELTKICEQAVKTDKKLLWVFSN